MSIVARLQVNAMFLHHHTDDYPRVQAKASVFDRIDTV